MPLKVKCLQCEKELTPPQPHPTKGNVVVGCECDAIRTRANGAVIVVYYNVRTHGARPFEIFDPRQKAQEKSASDK